MSILRFTFNKTRNETERKMNKCHTEKHRVIETAIFSKHTKMFCKTCTWLTIFSKVYYLFPN